MKNGTNHLLLGLIKESPDLCDQLAKRIVAEGDRAAIRRIVSSHIQFDPEKVWELLSAPTEMPEGRLPVDESKSGSPESDSPESDSPEALNGQSETFKKRIVTFLRKNPGAARGDIVVAVALDEFGRSVWERLKDELLDEKRIRRKGLRGNTRYWAR